MVALSPYFQDINMFMVEKFAKMTFFKNGTWTAPLNWPAGMHIPIALLSNLDEPKRPFERYGNDLIVLAFYDAWSRAKLQGKASRDG